MAIDVGTVAKVQKYADKRVAFLNSSDLVLAVFNPLSSVRRLDSGTGFKITDNNTGKSILLFVIKLTHYKLDPAAQVAFTGDTWQWWRLLCDQFFTVQSPMAIASELVNDSSVYGENITEALDTLALGCFPIGFTAYFPNVLGSPVIASNWQLCDGSLITNILSPMVGQNTPIIANNYIRIY